LLNDASVSEHAISTLTQHEKGSKKFIITIEFEHEKLQLQKLQMKRAQRLKKMMTLKTRQNKR
jgi:hypothetical protein